MTFPALTPSSRAWTPGEYLNTQYLSWGGRESRVRNSSSMERSELRLTFIGLSEAEMLQFLTHYISSNGTYAAFDLPSATWSGVSIATDYKLTGYAWRYAESPSVEDLPCGGHQVSIRLVSVPPQGSYVAGMDLFINYLLLAPTPVNQVGLNVVVSLSFKPGVASGNSPGTGGGMTQTLALSVSGTGATGAASIAGLTATVSITVTPGTTTAAAVVTGISSDVSFAFAIPSDAAFTNVSFLLAMTGANNGTSFPDSSSYNLTVQQGDSSSSVQTKTAVSRFNGSSAYFAGAIPFSVQGHNLLIPSNVALDVLPNNFCMEAWVYPTSNPASSERGIISIGADGPWGTANHPHVYMVQTSTGALRLVWASGTGTTDYTSNSSLTSTATINTNEWSHVVAMVQGSTVYLGINGAVVSSGGKTFRNPSTTPQARIGSISGYNSTIYGAHFVGYMAQARLTRAARSEYTTTYTVPDAPFAPLGPIAYGAASGTGATETVTASLDPGAASV